MEPAAHTRISVETVVHADIEKTWLLWTTPGHIMKWNNASADWHTPKAENDLRTGGSFSYRMEAKDGSFGFDFNGIYDEVKPHEWICYTMEDGRKVEISFKSYGGKTDITEIFDAENENPIELQRDGWQAILDNFKKYAEAH